MNFPSENDLTESPTAALLNLRAKIDEALHARHKVAQSELAALDRALGNATPERKPRAPRSDRGTTRERKDVQANRVTP